jgi:hypothetical protein
MSLEIVFTNDGLGVSQNFSGNLSPADISKSLSIKKSDPKLYKSLLYIIFNFEDVNKLSVTPIESASLARRVKQHFIQDKHKPFVVCVLNTELDLEIIKHWQAISNETDWEMIVAKNSSDAQNLIHESLRHIDVRDLYYSFMYSQR